MKNIRLLSIGFLFLVFCSSVTWGQTDFIWQFGTTLVGDSNSTSGSLANLTVSPVAIGNTFGTLSTMLDNSVPSTTYGTASGGYKADQACTIGSLVTTPGGSAYFEIVLTPASGYPVTLSNIKWGNRSTATGPEAFVVKTDKDQYLTNAASGSLAFASAWEYISPSVASVTGISGVPLHVRIYGYAGTGAAQPSATNWNIDDLDLTVSVALASPTPYLAVNPWTLSGFTYPLGSGPSPTQTYTLTGVGLDGSAVTVTPPSGFEVSTNAGSTWNSTAFTVPYTAPNLSQVLTVRLKAGLAGGIYSGNIQNSGGGASNKNCIVSGNVSVPTLTWVILRDVYGTNPIGISTSYILGHGPSATMTYTITGSDLSAGSVTLTAPSNFQISTDSSSWGSSKSIAIVSGAVAATKVFVRLVVSLSIGSYPGNYLTAAGGGAPTANQSLSGSVTASGLQFNEDFIYTAGTNLAGQA